MESNSDLEFEHFLGDQLGMTVDQLRQQLSSDEFVRWSVYYSRKAQREQLEQLKAQNRKPK